MKPGLRRDLPADQYHAWDACSASVLKQLAKYAPAQVRHDKLHPKADTAAMAFGSMLHTCLLEPHRLDEDYVLPPQVNRRTKAGRAEWAAFEAESDITGKILIGAQDRATVQAMVDAAYRNPFVRALLTAPGGINEGSVAWTHPVHGIPCKLRFDRVVPFGGQTLVIDVKSAQDASPDGFARAIANQGYHIAAGWYLDGLDAAVGKADRTFLWIAQDKEEPHLCAVYQPSAEMLAQGQREAQRLCSVYAHCQKTGEWPGYTPHGQAQVLDLPRWARKTDPNSMEIDF